jgi:hypothetical protein
MTGGLRCDQVGAKRELLKLASVALTHVRDSVSWKKKPPRSDWHFAPRHAGVGDGAERLLGENYRVGHRRR